jgi:hypothetical protein
MLDRNRKKELQEQYKQMKSDMCIFAIRNKENGKCWLATSQNLKGAINSALFKLNFGNFPVRDLQREWKALGANRFSVDILETLKYGKDETKTDYSEELAILRMIWEERLAGEGTTFYGSGT